MSCSGLPANAQCSFAPGVIYFANTTNGAGTSVPPAPQKITFTISTVTPAPTTVAGFLLPLGVLLLLSGWGLRKKLPARGMLVTLLMIAASGISLVAVSGCSSSFANTPKGTSNVVVNFIGSPNGTASVPTSGAGNIPNSFTIALTVQ
jgi:hypothetical protein